jgi:hypothetical protein
MHKKFTWEAFCFNTNDMPSRFHVTRNLRGHYYFISLNKNETLQTLWPPKIACASGNRFGIPGSLNTKPKAVKCDESQAKTHSISALNAAFVISTLYLTALGKYTVPYSTILVCRADFLLHIKFFRWP